MNFPTQPPAFPGPNANPIQMENYHTEMMLWRDISLSYLGAMRTCCVAFCVGILLVLLASLAL